MCNDRLRTGLRHQSHQPAYVIKATNDMLLRNWSKLEQMAIVPVEDHVREIQKQPVYLVEWGSKPCPEIGVWVNSVVNSIPAIYRQKWQVEVVNQRYFRFTRQIAVLGASQHTLQYATPDLRHFNFRLK